MQDGEYFNWDRRDVEPIVNGKGRIHPVILCGGSGTRLWPLSRQSFPKQFGKLLGEESLLQATLKRLSGERFAPPVIVTSADFRFIVRDQLAEIGVVPAAILIEPEPRNTAPAVLAASLWLDQQEPGALVLVAPSDHLMPDPEGFAAAVLGAVLQAERGGIVTFGITPERAETGYGYLELASELGEDGAQPQPLRGFIEKPDRAAAEAMLRSGRHLWNAGIFLFRSDQMISAFSELAAGMVQPVAAALAGAERDLAFLRLSPQPWSQAQSVSIDYAIMEKAQNLWAMPYGGGWTDLGGWAAIWGESGPDAAGLVQSGQVLALDCEDSLLRSEEEGMTLVGIGLKDMVAVAMRDAVLVARKSDAQKVRDAVALLKERQVKQATAFHKDYRPWGWFETLALGQGFQVKRIVVLPGGSLSLQSHQHRAEHWVVVEGEARVRLGDHVRSLAASQSVYIPQGERHRLENPGTAPMVLIEVQTGSYLGEDDIVRYEDVYARR